MSNIKLIVGLNNPGAKYDDTRHNAGAWFIEEVARIHNTSFKEENKFFAKVAKIRTACGDVFLVLPSTFMNLSGKSVGAIANFYRIKPEEILVAHDELDLGCGIAKIKQGGGHGGHNGLKDIIAALGNNKNFYRLRIGIDHPGDRNLVTNYVLGKPSPDDRRLIDQAIDESTRSLDILFKESIEKAMNHLNGFKASL